MKTAFRTVFGLVLLSALAGCATINRIEEIKRDDDSVYLQTTKQTIYIAIGPWIIDSYEELIHECIEDEEEDGTPVLECETVDLYINGSRYSGSSE